VIFFVRRANLYSRLLRTSIILLIVEAKRESPVGPGLSTHTQRRVQRSTKVWDLGDFDRRGQRWGMPCVPEIDHSEGVSSVSFVHTGAELDTLSIMLHTRNSTA